MGLMAMSELEEWQATHTVRLGVRAESPLLYDQPQTQHPMPDADRRCGTCRHYNFATGPTGRKRPTEFGYCGWTCDVLQHWPQTWPDAYCVKDGWQRRGPAKPYPSGRTAHGGRHCECWEARVE